jgi:hypothetical protein
VRGISGLILERKQLSALIISHIYTQLHPRGKEFLRSGSFHQSQKQLRHSLAMPSYPAQMEKVHEVPTPDESPSPGLGDEKIEQENIEDIAKDDSGNFKAEVHPSRFTKEEEESVIRKLDWHLMPLIFILYSFSVLDRSNLGNAKVAGMQDDIDIGGNRYAWLGTIFYISCKYPQTNRDLSRLTLSDLIQISCFNGLKWAGKSSRLIDGWPAQYLCGVPSRLSKLLPRLGQD